MKLKTVLFASALASIATSPAFAAQQDSQTPPAKPEESPPASEASPKPDEKALEDIIVTATRRSENLQEVPVAVTAITGRALTLQGINDTFQLTRAVPSFYGGKIAGAFQPVIRGVAFFGNSEADEANVGMYVDGIYQPGSLANVVEFADVSRIEVLRGPQGTLFGRNATGGLINIITPDPEFTARGHATVGASFVNGAQTAWGGRFAGYATGPFSDTVAGNISALYKYTGPYYKDVSTGKFEAPTEDVSVRGKLLYDGGDTRVMFTASYRWFDHSIYQSSAPLGYSLGATLPGGIGPTKPFEISQTQPPKYVGDRGSLSALLEHDFGGVKLISTSDIQRDYIDLVQDTDGSNLPQQGQTVFQEMTTISEELRLVSQGDGPFKWGIGLYGLRSDFDSGAALYAGSVTNVFARVTPDNVTKSGAIFANASLDLTDALSIDGGLRYSKEKRRLKQTTNGVQRYDARLSFDKLTYQGAIRYKLGQRINTYLSRSTGFKSGILNVYAPFTPQTVRPETMTATELGLKGDFTNWLRLNVAVFRQIDEDMQVTARFPNTNVVGLLNADKARQQGIEVEASGNLTDEFSYSIAGSLLDAEYVKFPNAIQFGPDINSSGLVRTNIDAAGKNMSRAPKHSINVMGDYHHEFQTGKLNLNASIYHSARVFFDFGNLYSQKPYTLLSASASWTLPGDHWEFRLSGTNLTNEVVFAQGVPNNFVVYTTWLEPRRVNIEASYRF